MPSARLQQHREALESSGGCREWLVFDELDPDELKSVACDMFARTQDVGKPPNERLANVLMKWGVVCQHPMFERLYLGRYAAFEKRPIDVPLDPPWFFCKSCGLHVINRKRNVP